MYTRLKTSLLVCFALPLLLACLPLRAAFYVPAPEMLSMSSFINTQYLNNTMLMDKYAKPTEATGKDPLLVSRNGGSEIPRKLAATYPAQIRQDAERLFSQLLDKYGELEKALGVPHGDLSGAVAAFITGAYMAYHDVQVPDAQFKTLVGQVRGMLGANPKFERFSELEKREFYDQMAIIGTYLAVAQLAQSQQPDARVAENMRKAAAGYLKQFLGVEPSRIRIDAAGLSII